MKKKENILFICAHSDDHVFGAGGTISKYSEEGKNIIVIILSYGEKTHPWLKPHITKAMRANEAYEADKILGCKSIFFDLNEYRYQKEFPAIEEKVLSIVKNIAPSKIFTHTNEDPHPDHKACFSITKSIIKNTGIKTELYLFPIWNPLSRSKSSEPSMYVDITATHNKKIEAMKKFRSQWAALALLVGGILARELKNGLHIKTRFAERFVRLR